MITSIGKTLLFNMTALVQYFLSITYILSLFESFFYILYDFTL